MMKKITITAIVLFGFSGTACAQHAFKQLSGLLGEGTVSTLTAPAGTQSARVLTAKNAPVEIDADYREFSEFIDNTSQAIAKKKFDKIDKRLRDAHVEIISGSLTNTVSPSGAPDRSSWLIKIIYRTALKPREVKVCGHDGYPQSVARAWLDQKNVLINTLSTPYEAGDFGEGPLMCIWASYQPLTEGAMLHR